MVVGAVIDRVPAVVERVQREITLARFIGKLAVDQGVRELRSRVESLTEPLAPPGKEPAAEPDASAARLRDVATQPTGDRAPVPAVTELALDDYDELPASNIVAKLPSLEPDERAAIAAYERAGRHRRTVLGKVEQLGDDRATS